MNKLLLFFAYSLVSYFVSNAYALDELECSGGFKELDTTKLFSDVEERYKKINDFSARFIQESFFLGSDQKEQSLGDVYFKRPGKMDWEYSTPDTQRFVSDSKIVWWYQPKQNQVSIRNLEKSFTSDVPLSFLLGVGNLKEKFTLDSVCASQRGILLKLTPKAKDNNLQDFYLLVDAKDHSPVGAKIVDIGGNENSILFTELKYNIGVEEKHFSFDIPKGTDIIDERAASNVNLEIK
ncbi:MAG: outer membrane lipoprotein chaperone LolA [Proteobacteria bacterium]|nr:outer membrane lipoprotein chaperone LolA [Pseudomonadota bacterium]